MQNSYGARCIKWGTGSTFLQIRTKTPGKTGTAADLSAGNMKRVREGLQNACMKMEIRLPKPGKTCIGKAILLL